MMGFHTTVDGGGRGLHDSSSPGPDCSVRSPDTPGGGLYPAEVLGYGRPLSTTEALEHTASILGGLPALHRRVVRRERSGVIRPRVRGRPTTALNSGANDTTPLLPHYAAVKRGESAEN